MDKNYIASVLKRVDDGATRTILSEILKELEEMNAPAELLFAKVKPEAIVPTKREEDAGFDMYACVDEDGILIQPHQTMLIPTGIATCFSPKYMYKLSERGSTGTKGIAQRCGVIDSGYRNEIQAPVTNLNEKPILILKDELGDVVKIRSKKKNGKEKILVFDTREDASQNTTLEELKDDCIIYPMSKAITQGILVEIPTTETEEIPYDELKHIPSARGMGAWGSSQK